MRRFEKRVLQVLFIFTYVHILTTRSDGNVYNGTRFRYLRQASFMKKDAIKACNKLGGSWDIAGGRNPEMLEMYMTERKIPSSWLPLEKSSFKRWIWVNDKIYFKAVAEDVGNHCAGVAVQGMRIQSMNCAEQGNGFVCQMKNREQCGEKYLRLACIEVQQTWYIVGCFSDNWYDARSYCRFKGGDLAILDTDEKQQAILNFIIDKKFFQTCSWLYAGLRKEDWYLIRSLGNRTEKEVPEQVYWKPDHPRHDRDCAILERNTAGYGWVSTLCTTEQRVVCQYYGNLTREKGDDKQTVEDACESMPGNWISIALGIFSLALIIIIIVVLLIWRGAIKLPSCNTRNFQVITLQDQIKQFKGTTVVIFSNILQGLPKDTKSTELLNISDQMKTTHVDSSGKLLNDCIRTYTQNGGSAPLRLAVIMCLDSDRKLPENIVNTVLKYLLKNSDSVEVVYLPTFITARENHTENLMLLWELRQKVVLVCEANRDADLPGTEVIAVGRHYPAQSFPSSVVDVTVPVEAESDTHVGPSVVAGVAAAIISKNQDQWASEPRKTNVMRKLLIDHVRGGDYDFYQGFGTVKAHVDTDSIDLNRYTTKKKAISESIEDTSAESNTTVSVTNIVYDHSKTNGKTVTIGFIRKGIAVSDTAGKGWKVVVNNPHRSEVSDTNVDPSRITQSRKCREMFNLDKVFTKSGIDRTILQNVIEIRDIPIFNIGWWVKADDLKYAIEKQNLDIVYLSVLGVHIPVGYKIFENTNKLRERSVLITSAMAITRPPIPCNFPVQCAIAVGCQDVYKAVRQHSRTTSERSTKSLPEEETLLSNNQEVFVTAERKEPVRKGKMKWQSIGSVLDFVCCGADFDNPDDDLCTWSASFYATAVAALVIVQAYALGFEENVIEKLKSTSTMQAILREMCSHSHKHDMFDGWGTLKPWNTLRNPKAMHSLIMKYTAEIKPANYWAGKNV